MTMYGRDASLYSDEPDHGSTVIAAFAALGTVGLAAMFIFGVMGG